MSSRRATSHEPGYNIDYRTERMMAETTDTEAEWEQVTYFLAPRFRVVEEADGWRVFKRVDSEEEDVR